MFPQKPARRLIVQKPAHTLFRSNDWAFTNFLKSANTEIEETLLAGLTIQPRVKGEKDYVSIESTDLLPHL